MPEVQVIEGTSIKYSLRYGPQIWENILIKTQKNRAKTPDEERVTVIPNTAITVNADEYEEFELISEETFIKRMEKRLAREQNTRLTKGNDFFKKSDKKISKEEREEQASNDDAPNKSSRERG